jgi:cysteine desulfuration protein SufE
MPHATPSPTGSPALPETAVPAAALPDALARTLRQFRLLEREDKMQALLGWSKKLEPLPARLAELDRAAFTVPECQTRVDIFPERQADGTLHFYADVNARQSPTVAAVLAITFAAVNDQPPAVTLALPSDVVRLLMQDIGLGARESGLSAMIARLKRFAAQSNSEGTE